MLTLSVVEANQAGASVVTWLGVISLAAVAAIAVGLWIFVARRLAQGARDLATSTEDEREIESLSQTRLVVRRGGDSGSRDTVVSELEHSGEAGPRHPSPESRFGAPS
jgi:hypothetical protein